MYVPDRAFEREREREMFKLCQPMKMTVQVWDECASDELRARAGRCLLTGVKI